MGDDRPERPRTGRVTGSSVLTPPIGVPAFPDDAGALLAPVPDVQAAVPCTDRAPAVPAAAAASVPPDVAALPSSCLCGHGAPAHEHWRRGTDCGVCGATECPSFRRRGGRVRRLLRRLRLVR